MKKIVIISILLLSLSLVGNGQKSMEEGFALLETQSYDQAADFFSTVLEEEPQNKTARICYGRAVGLGGDTRKGLDVFTALIEDFPLDYEVQLNLAEGLMWEKSYDKALSVYEELLQKDSSNYVANLGYANANASLKDNSKALTYINKAIQIDKENQGAIISKKYILLALADDARKVWNYDLSHFYLDQVFQLYPDDKDGLLNRATIYLSDQKINSAKNTFQKLLDKDLAPIDALLGLSYTALLKDKKRQSLRYAEDAVEKANTLSVSPELYLRAAINEVNALAINRKYKKAVSKLDSLDQHYPEAIEVKLAKARIKVWDKQEIKGLRIYEEIGQEYPQSFELLMGQAEAYRSLKERNIAKEYITRALEIQPKQPDAFRLLEELKAEGKAVLSFEAGTSGDVGGNDAKEGKVHFEMSIGDKHRAFAQYFYRHAIQQKEGINSNQQVVLIGDNWIVNSKLRINASVGKVFGSSLENTQNSSLLNAGANYSFLKRHELGFRYGREAHNYTVDLINSGIIMDHLTGSYSFQLPVGLGTYNFYTHTFQTDGNKRDLFFSSVYYNIKNNPLFKIGVNLSKVTYQQKASELYFSPSNLKSGEAFFETSNLYDHKKKITYKIFTAIGNQKIEDQEVQITRRIELLLGYKLHRGLQMQAYFNNSNAAQANAIGFSYTSYGLRFSMSL